MYDPPFAQQHSLWALLQPGRESGDGQVTGQLPCRFQQVSTDSEDPGRCCGDFREASAGRLRFGVTAKGGAVTAKFQKGPEGYGAGVGSASSSISRVGWESSCPGFGKVRKFSAGVAFGKQRDLRSRFSWFELQTENNSKMQVLKTC